MDIERTEKLLNQVNPIVKAKMPFFFENIKNGKVILYNEGEYMPIERRNISKIKELEGKYKSFNIVAVVKSTCNINEEPCTIESYISIHNEKDLPIMYRNKIKFFAFVDIDDGIKQECGDIFLEEFLRNVYRVG